VRTVVQQYTIAATVQSFDSAQPTGAMNWNAKERSEVALNRIWTEHVDKETQFIKPKTQYTCNPCSSISMNNGLGSRVPFVTEKVGFSVGLEPIEVGDDPDVKAVVEGLLNAQKVPAEKMAEPITSAQEVGWYAKPLVAANPRFVHGLKQAEATQFAETYTKKMAGEHMFHGKSGKYLKF